jgi:hypothetical protein
VTAQLMLPRSANRAALLEPWAELEQRRGEWVPSVDVNPEYRRAITRYSPIRFALLYFPHLLRSPETGNHWSLAEHHIAMAASAARWALPGRHRDAWVAPRGAAKTTWWAILIMWALCHGHRRLALLLSDAREQAQLPMATMRTELRHNRLLLHDYPDMAPPRAGRGARDSQDTYRATGGAIIAVRGMNTAKLGLNIDGRRPDLIVLDDIEPGGSKYSAADRDKRLGTVLHDVLPMNEQAAVVLSGTVTMYGSIMHAVVRYARRAEVPAKLIEPWIDDEAFTVHYVPAIVTEPDGTERSFWEQRYSLAYLVSIRHTLNYALNFAGWPPLPGGHHWKRETFRYGQLGDGARLVLQLDPAPTANPTSDYTALTVGGLRYDGDVPVAVVIHGSKFRATAGGIAERVERHLASPTVGRFIREVRVESNQGADLWRPVLQPVCDRYGVKLTLHPAGRMSKVDRISRALHLTELGQVEHAGILADLETDLQQWPEIPDGHDDLPDAYAHLVRHLLGDDG